jgi:hypothetical protein
MKLETKVFYISECVIINSGKWYQNEYVIFHYSRQKPEGRNQCNHAFFHKMKDRNKSLLLL